MNKEIPPGATLLCKAKLLERLSRKKTWLHDLMNPEAKRYYDPTFPLPITLGNSRNPLWISTEVDEWIASAALRSRRPATHQPSELLAMLAPTEK